MSNATIEQSAPSVHEECLGNVLAYGKYAKLFDQIVILENDADIDTQEIVTSMFSLMERLQKQMREFARQTPKSEYGLGGESWSKVAADILRVKTGNTPGDTRKAAVKLAKALS